MCELSIHNGGRRCLAVECMGSVGAIHPAEQCNECDRSQRFLCPSPRYVTTFITRQTVCSSASAAVFYLARGGAGECTYTQDGRPAIRHASNPGVFVLGVEHVTLVPAHALLTHSQQSVSYSCWPQIVTSVSAVSQRSAAFPE